MEKMNELKKIVKAMGDGKISPEEAWNTLGPVIEDVRSKLFSADTEDLPAASPRERAQDFIAALNRFIRATIKKEIKSAEVVLCLSQFPEIRLYHQDGGISVIDGCASMGIHDDEDALECFREMECLWADDKDDEEFIAALGRGLKDELAAQLGAPVFCGLHGGTKAPGDRERIGEEISRHAHREPEAL